MLAVMAEKEKKSKKTSSQDEGKRRETTNSGSNVLMAEKEKKPKKTLSQYEAKRRETTYSGNALMAHSAYEPVYPSNPKDTMKADSAAETYYYHYQYSDTSSKKKKRRKSPRITRIRKLPSPNVAESPVTQILPPSDSPSKPDKPSNLLSPASKTTPANRASAGTAITNVPIPPVSIVPYLIPNHDNTEANLASAPNLANPRTVRPDPFDFKSAINRVTPGFPRPQTAGKPRRLSTPRKRGKLRGAAGVDHQDIFSIADDTYYGAGTHNIPAGLRDSKPVVREDTIYQAWSVVEGAHPYNHIDTPQDPPQDKITKVGDKIQSRVRNSSSLVRIVKLKRRVFLPFLRQRARLIQLISTLLVLAISIGLGIHLRHVKPPLSARQIMYIGFPGELMMRMLRMISLPLIITSIVTALCNTQLATNIKTLLRVLLYNYITNLIAVCIGLIFVFGIKPGHSTPTAAMNGTHVGTVSPHNIDSLDILLDIFRSLFPWNLAGSLISQPQTQYGIGMASREGSVVSGASSMETECINGTNSTSTCAYLNSQNNNGSNPELTRSNHPVFITDEFGGSNLLGIVVFTSLFGMILGRTGPESYTLRETLGSLYSITTTISKLIIWFTPLGAGFLIVAEFLRDKSLMSLFSVHKYYFITLISALTVHGFIILPALYAAITRKNPCVLMLSVYHPLVVGYITSSSIASVPVTMQAVQKYSAIDIRLYRFIIPLNSVINRDGTALYQTVTTIFLAQISYTLLKPEQIFLICLIAPLLSMVTAGIPNGTLATTILVLHATGQTNTDTSYLVAFDWLIGRFRVVVDILSDCFCCGIIQHFASKDLNSD